MKKYYFCDRILFLYFFLLMFTHSFLATSSSSLEPVLVTQYTVDEKLSFSTFFGASGDDIAYAIEIDSEKNVYIAGWSDSDEFPLINAYNQERSSGDKMIFIAKLTPDGSEVLYSTYITGTNDAFSSGTLLQLAVDSNDNIIIAASTDTNDLITTQDALFSRNIGNRDIILVKLSADGSNLLYSTYFGGTGHDSISGLVLDSEDNIYLSGQTASTDFPTTDSTTHKGGLDVYIAKISSVDFSLEFSILYGGSGNDAYPLFALDNQDNMWIAGSTTSVDLTLTTNALNTSNNGGEGWHFGGYLSSVDLYVAKFSSDGSELIYSSYFGGSMSEYINAMGVDSSDNIIFAGSTGSPDYPISQDAFDSALDGDLNPTWINEGFVTKLNSDGSEVIFSTYLGGTDYYEFTRALTIDKEDNIYLTGWTGSHDYPLSSDVFDPTPDPISSYSGGGGDAFVSVLSSDGKAMKYSSYLGGDGSDEVFAITNDKSSGSVFIVGTTRAIDFPVTINAIDTDANGNKDVFVTRLDLGLVGQITTSSTSSSTTTSSSTETTTSANTETSPSKDKKSDDGFLIVSPLPIFLVLIILQPIIRKKGLIFKNR